MGPRRPIKDITQGGSEAREMEGQRDRYLENEKGIVNKQEGTRLMPPQMHIFRHTNLHKRTEISVGCLYSLLTYSLLPPHIVLLLMNACLLL